MTSRTKSYLTNQRSHIGTYLILSEKVEKVSKVSCTKFQISRQNAACRKKHIGWQPTMCGRDLATIAHLICNKSTGLTLIYLHYNRQQTQVLTNKHIQYIHLSSRVIFLSNVAGPYNAEAPDPLVGPFGVAPPQSLRKISSPACEGDLDFGFRGEGVSLPSGSRLLPASLNICFDFPRLL